MTGHGALIEDGMLVYVRDEEAFLFREF